MKQYVPIMTSESVDAECSSRLKFVKVEENYECGTFELVEEDHTLGNALRYMIQKNPNVKFCGYSLPHPNERRVRLQIQMYEGKGSAIEALEKGFNDLMILYQHIKSVFESEVNA